MNPLSRVNQILRNPRRIFNHLALIDEKLAIGRKWHLVRGQTDQRSYAMMDILSSLQRGAITLDAATTAIASAHGRPFNELITDMQSAYRTGLLELHITDRCDLDCVDCHYAHKTGATIPYDRLPSILAHLAPRAITITGGGEPNMCASQGRTLCDVVLLIHEILPDAQIGIINNNSRIPAGNWTNHISWQRSSIDAAHPDTYRSIKRVDKYHAVVSNVERLLYTTPIPDVGIGFLYRSENAGEIFSFLTQWHRWYEQQPASVQQRFNIQFRPIAPPIERVAAMRESARQVAPYLHGLRDEVRKTLKSASENDSLAGFLSGHTNFHTVIERLATENPSVHAALPFSHCYNALAHRVFRAHGAEYPDFLLVEFPNFALGNSLTGDAQVERTRIGLAQYFFHNRGSEYCTPDSCRQSWLNHLVEHPNPETLASRPLDHYFF